MAASSGCLATACRVCVEPTPMTASGAGWIGLRANRDYVTGQRDGPLLPAPLALVLVLAVLVIAWRQESR